MYIDQLNRFLKPMPDDGMAIFIHFGRDVSLSFPAMAVNFDFYPNLLPDGTPPTIGVVQLKPDDRKFHPLTITDPDPLYTIDGSYINVMNRHLLEGLPDGGLVTFYRREEARAVPDSDFFPAMGVSSHVNRIAYDDGRESILVVGESSQAELCRRHNLSEDQLSKWKQQFVENAVSLFASTDKHSSEATEHIAHLEQLVGRLTVALDIQKKASTGLS